MNILYTVLFTFPKVVTRRICLTIKSFCISDSGVILYGELVASHPKGFKGENLSYFFSNFYYLLVAVLCTKGENFVK